MTFLFSILNGRLDGYRVIIADLISARGQKADSANMLVTCNNTEKKITK